MSCGMDFDQKFVYVLHARVQSLLGPIVVFIAVGMLRFFPVAHDG